MAMASLMLDALFWQTFNVNFSSELQKVLNTHFQQPQLLTPLHLNPGNKAPTLLAVERQVNKNRKNFFCRVSTHFKTTRRYKRRLLCFCSTAGRVQVRTLTNQNAN